MRQWKSVRIRSEVVTNVMGKDGADWRIDQKYRLIPDDDFNHQSFKIILTVVLLRERERKRERERRGK